MNRALAIVFAIAIFITGIIGSPIDSNASDRSAHHGYQENNTPNLAVLCNKQLSEYARKKGYEMCAVTGCRMLAKRPGRYCDRHTCHRSNCTNKVYGDTNYCSVHVKKSTSSSTSGKNSYSSKDSSTSGKSYSNGSSSSKKSSSSDKKYDRNDIYDVYKYKSAQEFADAKYEEFYDYEDDYEDEEEAYDAAEDYWNDHH